IWRWPGRFSAGHAADEIVESVDFTATVCALAGLPALETSDGRDISHLLHGESGEVHRCGVTEFAWSKSLRRGRWRLVYYPPEMFPEEYPEGFRELYDLESDPWEMQNLYFEPEHDEVVRELSDELLRWLITTTRPTTVHPPTRWSSPQAVTRYNNTVNADGTTSPDRLRPGGNYL
ncbi:MAG: sulfatase/phosphatase domain-containing protein, partial [Armatimonadota bacterium]